MGFFGFGKKEKIIDLGERYRQKENEQEKNEGESDDSFKIVGNSSSSNSNYDNEPRKKLAKKLIDMTNKLDELSTQLYHLQQRVELLERKTGVKSGID